jgi:hypothetical protein
MMMTNNDMIKRYFNPILTDKVEASASHGLQAVVHQPTAHILVRNISNFQFHTQGREQWVQAAK